MIIRKKYEVKNIDSEDAPPFAVLEIVRLNVEEGWIEVQRPTSEGNYEVLIEVGNGIAADALGSAYSPFDYPPLCIRYNPDDGTPAKGQDWGTVADDWRLGRYAVGFRPVDLSEGESPAVDTAFFLLKVCQDVTV